MTREELIALAKEAGFVPNYGISPLPMVDYATCGLDPKLERFAALVAAKEREECAILVEYLDLYSGDRLKNSDPRTTCAAAIRARKP